MKDTTCGVSGRHVTAIVASASILKALCPPRLGPSRLMGHFLLVLGVLTLTCGEVIQLSTNECQESVDGVMRYYACTSEPLHVMQTAEYRTTITPGVTCGDPPTQFCSLAVNTCQTCDSSIPALSHTVAHMFDRLDDDQPNLNTWWQTNTRQTLPGPLEVNITFSFNKSHELSDILQITFYGSRPREMQIISSSDYGLNWTLLAAYASDCTSYYADGLKTTFTHEDPSAVVCSEAYSDVTPSANGTVIFSARERFLMFLGDDMSDFGDLYEALDNSGLGTMLQFTDIRLRFMQPASFPGPLGVDLRKYSYGIADIDMVAGCYCNLHGKTCEVRQGYRVCVCKHNTAGDNCEKCLPLYNNRPWAPGKFLPQPNGTPNECIKCECHDHADGCEYNTALKMGVCRNCYHHTTGHSCNRCLEGFIRNHEVALNHSDVCSDCNCEPFGVLEGDRGCDDPSGQCLCKALVEGLKCDRCQDGYYGLLEVEPQGECEACNCHQDGTRDRDLVCNNTSGQCPCKPHITGRDCSECAEGYFRFPQGSPDMDCLSCDCDPGASISGSCDVISGQCSCRPGILGMQCTEIEPHMYVPNLDAVQYEATGGTCKRQATTWSLRNPFTGRFLYECVEGQYVTFTYSYNLDYTKLPDTWLGQPVLRYSLNGSALWANLEMTWRVWGSAPRQSCPLETGTVKQIRVDNLIPGMGEWWRSSSMVTVDTRCAYEVRVDVGSPGAGNRPGELSLDSVLVLPDYSQTNIYQLADSTIRVVYEDCVEGIMGLRTNSDTLGDKTCSDFVLSTMAQFIQGALDCVCFEMGTREGTGCVGLGGQCQCQDRVAGRACDACAPGYHNMTSSGCELCPYLPCPEDLLLDANTGDEDNSAATAGLVVAICIIVLLFIIVIVILVKRDFHRKVVNKLSAPDPQVSYIDLGLRNPSSPIYSKKVYADYTDAPGGEPEDVKKPSNVEVSSLRGSFNSVDRYNATVDHGHTNQAFAMKELQEDPFVDRRRIPRRAPSQLSQTSSHTSRQQPRPPSQASQTSSQVSRRSRQLPQIPTTALTTPSIDNRANENRERRQRPRHKPSRRRPREGRRDTDGMTLDELHGSLV